MSRRCRVESTRAQIVSLAQQWIHTDSNNEIIRAKVQGTHKLSSGMSNGPLHVTGVMMRVLCLSGTRERGTAVVPSDRMWIL